MKTIAFNKDDFRVIKFKDILPNPYRDLIHNPLREEIIEDLRDSVKTTGFWDNVAVRRCKGGKYELGGGHHRLEAAKREGLTEAFFVIKPWDESQIIKVKHKEDKARKVFDTPTMIESVRAVVNALAAGAIPPFTVDEKTKKSSIRYAPSFVAGKDEGPTRPLMAYTALHVAEFLGETKSRGNGTEKANTSVSTALDALALIEQQELSEASLENIPLDNPSGDTKKMGLIQRVQVKKAQREVRLEATKTAAERAALDKTRHEQEQADKERRAELLRQEREANKEKDEAEAKRIADEIKRQKEREELRQIAFEESRARLDAKVKEANERAEEAKVRDKDLPTRHAVKAMLFKLNTIVSETFAFREDVKAMARDRTVTTNERELLRQAMMRAGDWYLEQANQFLPRPKVNVLAEAQQRENSKRKIKGQTEGYIETIKEMGEEQR